MALCALSLPLAFSPDSMRARITTPHAQAAAVSKALQRESEDLTQSLASFTLNAQPAAPSPASAADGPLQLLVAMGFPQARASAALARTDGNLDRALDLLSQETPPRTVPQPALAAAVAAARAPAPAAAPPPSRRTRC